MTMKPMYLRPVALLGPTALVTSLSALAQVLDVTGPPPVYDPSALTQLNIGNQIYGVDLQNLLPAMVGAVEVWNYELADAGENNGLLTGTQAKGGDEKYDVPTGAAASPLYGAQPFSQQMLRFEEFGMQRLDPTVIPETAAFPMPTTGPSPFQDPGSVAASQPEPTALDAFLDQAGIYPFPTEFSNILDPNPWTGEIEDFLGRALDGAPAEGRPGGRGWAHQRWNEFYPQSYFKTAHTGARTNGGLRDKLQHHKYATGEFAPGGLYHDTVGTGLNGTTAGINITFHPDMPIQNHKSLWTFDGTLPPKLLMTRVGEPVLMRHFNALPIDPTANRGFGLHTITTHEHNGHNPAESDGFTNAYFFPGQYYDYRWPMQIAGYDSINTTAENPLASFPCADGEQLFVNDLNPDMKECVNGLINVRGDHREIVSTHWFHDHMFEFTAQNVYKGNAAMLNYYSGKDRGNESVDDGVNLRFPSGSELAWGNRDYDVNLVIADKAWDKEGQLWFNIFNLDGFLGDVMTTNWLYKPFLDVRARSYRFRILNGSVSRYFKLALVQEVTGRTTGEINGAPGQNISWNRIPFYMIANDGNILEHAVAFDGSTDLDYDGDADEHKGVLPTQSIAERYDIIVDFSKHGLKPGDRLYFVNILEHKNGKIVEGTVPLRQVLRGRYKAERKVDSKTGFATWKRGDPVVGKFLELRVQAYAGVDQSMNPADYVEGAMAMTELPWDRDKQEDVDALADARHRSFKFGRSSGTDRDPWTTKTDGGDGLTADPRRISVAPQLATGPTEAGFAGDGTREIWSLSTGGGWSHPIHIHFEEGIIISKDGELPPMWEIGARKDVFRLGKEEDSTRDIEIVYQFREFAGSFLEHCHNTQHEDHAMLLRWDLEHPGQVKLMPAVIPTWDGVEYIDSVALPTFREGDGDTGIQDGIPD